jgi:phage regulator Rha-like protein
MNNIISITDPSVLTMSSREISDLVDSRHDKVKQSIERLAERGVIDLPPLGEYLDSLGRTAREYKIGKRDSYIIVAQLSPEFTARLVDRWQELEQQASNPIANLTRIDLLKLALDSEEKRIALEHKVEELEPKANALDLISADTDSLTITEASKLLGVKRKDLYVRLHAEGWIYRLNGAWVAYDRYIKNGCLTYKEAKYTDEKTGQECRKPYCHVTPKGLTKLAGIFSVEFEVV